MKTLEKGRTQKGWAREYRCSGDGHKGGGCSALLLVEFGDIFKFRNEDGTHLAFRCSECGVLTNIKITDPPDFDQIPDRANWESIQKSTILHG